jgi:hypothetical protein
VRTFSRFRDADTIASASDLGRPAHIITPRITSSSEVKLTCLERGLWEERGVVKVEM